VAYRTLKGQSKRLSKEIYGRGRTQAQDQETPWDGEKVDEEEDELFGTGSPFTIP
jgi:hypothetical protein